MVALRHGKLRALWIGAFALVTVLPLLTSALARPVAARNIRTRPNILLLLTDDQTMRSLEHMPYLSSQPEGNWVSFERAVISTPMCCPSRVTILTGQYSHEHGVISNNGRKFDDDESLAVWLDREGYRTGLIGKYLNEYPFGRGETYIPPGWDYWNAVLDSGNEADYYRYSMSDNGTVRTYGSEPQDYQTDVLTSDAVDFIESGPPIRPFFLMVSYRAPHRAADGGAAIPAPRHEGAYEDLGFELPPSFNEANVADKPRWVRKLPERNAGSQIRAYRAEAESMLAVDESVATLMDTLSDRRALDNTVIVFMTDNGYARGEHRWVTKQCPYAPCYQTPLLIRYPGAEQRTDARLVSNVDIAPTLADVGDATPQLPQDGKSLVPLLTGKDGPWRDSALLAWRARRGTIPAWWSILTRRWQFTTLASGERELYDVKKDPFQLRNLASRRGYGDVRRSLERRLRKLKRAP
ncbi:MAG TPA: sulfatase [Actinomycetota bacterium]|jgi:arylsulfatase A-like enzyme